MADKIQLRRDTAANWVINNPVLSEGEMGLEIDTKKIKMGDGITAWNSLSYNWTLNAILPSQTGNSGKYLCTDGSDPSWEALGGMSHQEPSAVNITGGVITGIQDLAIVDGGTGASTPADARTNLGLGTIATQNSNAVSITGGNITGTTIDGVTSHVSDLTGDVHGATSLNLANMIVRRDASGGFSAGTVSASIVVGSGKTLDVSSGTLILSDNQISGDKIDGGKISGLTGLLFATATELTITAGSITPTQTQHTINTESNLPYDELNTIIGGNDGQVLFIRAAYDNRTVIIKSTNNIYTGGVNITLTSTNKYVMFIYNLSLSKWVVVGSGTNFLSYEIISSNTTAEANRGYLINASSSSVVLTLPASPSLGDIVSVIDAYGKATTNIISIARNSSNIESQAQDLTFTANGSEFTFVYVDSTVGWKIISSNISNEAYDESSWNNVTYSAPSKNAVRDAIETLNRNMIAYMIALGS